LEARFYENECLKANWSKRQLQRQIGSLLYERTGLSIDKKAVIERARQQAAEAPADIAELIRDPYVLERGPAEARATPATHRKRPYRLGTAPPGSQALI
jgi:hypothetical protein